MPGTGNPEQQDLARFKSFGMRTVFRRAISVPVRLRIGNIGLFRLYIPE
jgi:hypothetical protein